MKHLSCSQTLFLVLFSFILIFLSIFSLPVTKQYHFSNSMKNNYFNICFIGFYDGTFFNCLPLKQTYSLYYIQ